MARRRPSPSPYDGRAECEGKKGLGEVGGGLITIILTIGVLIVKVFKSCRATRTATLTTPNVTRMLRDVLLNFKVSVFATSAVGGKADTT